jgi:hypothetical protein
MAPSEVFRGAMETFILMDNDKKCRGETFFAPIS